MSAGDWCLLESDPGLFSALIREFGSTGAQVDELWGLDPEVFKPLGKIFGLIFNQLILLDIVCLIISLYL